MLNHQEVVRILLKASPILISWADLENAILEQENAAENCSSKLSQETVDSLVILQVLYYVRNGGTANSYLAVADVASAQTLKRQVEEQATEIYLAYRLALPNLEYLLPSDSDDFKLLQAGIDGDKVACRQLALIFEDLGNEPAQQYWMNRSAFEFKIEYFSQTAESVAVTGDFDGWSQSCVLEKEDGLFTGTIDTLLDSIVFRFVVDGEWTTSDLYDTISVDGIINNYLKAEDSQAEEVSIAADKAVLGSVAELKYEERATELPESIAGEYSVVETITEIPPLEQTVALIKPDAYGAGRKDAIIERILEAGFNIALEAELIMSIEQAMEFYREHEGKSFYDNLINWMSSAPIYAMVLEKSDAIKAWRTLAGPTNSNIARETVPERLICN